MADPAHNYSDKQIKAFQREVASTYKQAMKDAQARLDAYLRKYEALDEKKRLQVTDGLLSEAEYKQWRRLTITVGKGYKNVLEQAAWCFTHANEIAIAALNGRIPAVFAENFNWQTYKVETSVGMDTAFTLQDANTIQNLIKDSSAYVALPKRKLQTAKDVAWNKRQIGAAVQQGIFLGESIPKIAKRVSQSVGEQNMRAATRIARTTVTAAESGGRLSALERAKDLGIDAKAEWLATLDGRTRHSHRLIDGEQVEVGEKFSNGCRYPGDPDAPYEETANCRCTLVAAFDDQDNDWKSEASERLMGQSYEEWKHGKERSIKNKRSISYTAPDMGYITSPEYRAKFNSLGVSDVVAKAIADAATNILQHRGKTGYESLYLLDSMTGKVAAKSTNPTQELETRLTQEVISAVKKAAPYTLIGIHNHPNCVPPTGSDIAAAFQRKYKFGIVVGHDGEVFYYNVSNAKEIHANTFDAKVTRFIEAGYEYNEAAIKALEQFAESHGLIWKKF